MRQILGNRYLILLMRYVEMATDEAIEVLKKSKGKKKHLGNYK